MTPTTPRTFSHIGLSVPDLDAAVAFYRDVMGFYVIMEPTEITQDDSAIGVMCNDVFGPGWGRFRIAHLATADRIGFELFEFPGNHRPDDNLPFRQVGLFHFAIQDPDLEGLLARIVAARPYQSLTDFWHRAHVSRPIVERLVLAGGLDSIYGIGESTTVHRRGTVTRRDLLLQVGDLDREAVHLEPERLDLAAVGEMRPTPTQPAGEAVAERPRASGS